MAAITPGSPFNAGGTAQNLPVKNRQGRVIIRCNDDDSANRIIIKIGAVADATHADFFLNAGEALEIHNSALPLRDDGITISVLNVGNDPLIYWGQIA